MKNVLYIMPASGLGGAERFMLQTAKYHRRWSPLYLLFRTGPLREELLKLGANVLLLSKPPRFRYPHSWFRSAREIYSTIRRENVALVHSGLAYGQIFSSLSARVARVPLIWYQHGPVGTWQDWLAGLLPSNAVIANSKFTLDSQKNVERKLPFSQSENTHIIPPGVDMSETVLKKTRDQVRKDWGVSEETFIAGLFGRIEPNKGALDFLEAIGKLSTQGGKILGLLFGRSGNTLRDIEYEKKLRERIDAAKIPVRIMGETSEPLQMMGACDAIVSATLSPEGLGMTLIEAQALGVIPVAPDQGGPKEIIKSEETGLLFAPRDSESLSSTLGRLIREPELRAKMEERLRNNAKRSAEEAVSRLEFVYDQICGKSGGDASSRGRS